MRYWVTYKTRDGAERVIKRKTDICLSSPHSHTRENDSVLCLKAELFKPTQIIKRDHV